MEKLLQTKIVSINDEMHSIKTILCEQYRIIQNIQLEKRPDGVLNKINDKIPGFSSTIYDLYTKLENT